MKIKLFHNSVGWLLYINSKLANTLTLIFSNCKWIWDPGTCEHRFSLGNLRYSGKAKHKSNRIIRGILHFLITGYQ